MLNFKWRLQSWFITKFPLHGALHSKRYKKSKGIKTNYKFCRVRVPLAFGSPRRWDSSPCRTLETFQNPSTAENVILRDSWMARMRQTSCSVEFDGTTVFTCGSNSATVQETITPFGFNNIYANSYQGLNLSSAFKAALYDSIKAKDCLCSGERGDWGPGFTAITHSTLTTRVLRAALFACLLPFSKQESTASGFQQHPQTVHKHVSFSTVSQQF